MSTTTAQPALPGKSRSRVVTKPATEFYGGIGWVIGLFLTIFVSAPVIWFLTQSASRANRAEIFAFGIAAAWWLNPLSLGGLFYVLSNIRVWKFWTLPALLVWVVVNGMISVSIADDGARGVVLNILSIAGLILLGLIFLYIQLRVFVWAASGNAGRFFFGILGWALLNALVVWALVNPDVLNIVLVALGFIFQVVFAIGFAIIQFVAIFWFMSQTRVEVIRPGDPKQITFDDYKGQPNLLRMVRQWIYLLSDREQFQKMGGQFITGLLLYGEPGTGKTLLAKAMAGEAGIAFISIEGSGFRGMFWGVDVLRMVQFVGRARKLAREYGACIAYIDEIDAVGMSRGSVMGGGQMMGGMMGMGAGSGALTRLLYEMDGIGTLTPREKLRARIYQFFKRKTPVRDWHVMFMGSTNRPDVLDPALVRPGRFDRKIAVGLPDRGGRREIVKYYLSKIKHDDTVDIEALVSDTSWATPARIMSAVTKDAVRLALFDGRDKISQRDIELAFQEQAIGLENPIEEMEEDQRRQVAYHEAGHAVAQYHLRPDERIVRVSIIRRADALGYVLPVSNFDVYAMPLRRFVADIMVSMAGHVATKVFFGEYWTGATGDFQNVRARLWQLAHYGYFGPPITDGLSMGADVSNGRGKIVEKFWQQLEDQTEHLLRVHSVEVEAVATALLERGDLTGRECVEIIRKASGVEQSEVKPEAEKILSGIVSEVTGRTNTPTETK